MQSCCPPEYHQVEQCVTPQTIGAVNGDTRSFTHRIEAVDALVIAIDIRADHLTMDVSRQAAHHVMAGWLHRYRFL